MLSLMVSKVKLLIVFLIGLTLWTTPLLGTTTPSPLSPNVWRATLERQAYLGETGDALIALAQQNPLFFGDLVPEVLAEGFRQHPDSFARENEELLYFVLQQFEVGRETGFRQGILAVAPQMPPFFQTSISKTELHFLLSLNPDQSHLRKREIQLWIRLTEPLAFSSQSFLMLYERAKDPSVRYFLRQAAKRSR
jgi:hypothetical protein